MPRLPLIAATIALAAAAIVVAGKAGGSSGQIDTAAPGAAIRWPAESGQKLTIANKSFNPAITIDASRATFSGIVIRNSRGVHIRGGTVIGPGGRSYGVHIDKSSDVAIEGMTVTGAHRGLVANRSSDLVIRNNQFVGLVSDGINLAQSSRALIQGNSCVRFRPRPATYDAAGKIIKDGDHPDCIQAWSRPDLPPVSDVKVIGNRAEGPMQGIFFGNHIRNGVDDGGFDRITIEGNIIHISFPRGITLGAGRNSIVRNNRISTVPGSVLPNRPNVSVVAALYIANPSNVLACGNRVKNAKTDIGLGRCPG